MDKVEPYDCWEGVVNGCLEDKDLDSILSILDFPIEGFEGDGFTEEWDDTKSHCLGPVPPDMLTNMGRPVLPPMPAKVSSLCLGPVPPDMTNTGLPVLPPMLTAKTDATLEPPYRLSSQPKDHPTSTNKFTDAHKELVIFHTQSPVSVLEGNNGISSIIKSCTSKRTRAKRARPSGPSPWLSMLPLFAPTKKMRKAKGRRKKPSPFPASEEDKLPNHRESWLNEVKKCAHCKVTKTPQWREGPTGPKTLCNACGVRYRSGRLFPEYRPAASPTFMPSMHSNSHRKVIEMRNKKV